MPETGAAVSERPQLKPFGQFLHEQRNGLLHDELSEELAELVKQCVETGKKGTLTLKVTVAPNKDDVTLLLTDAVDQVRDRLGQRFQIERVFVGRPR